MTSTERHEIRYQRRRAKRLQKEKERAEKYTEWENIFGLHALMDGYRNVSKASKDKTSTQIWMGNLTANARQEQKKLKDGNWKSPGFNNFRIKERGKWRDIQSAHISEKGIQNSFVNNCFIQIIEPHLIHDNGASLKGKGTDFSINRFTEHLRRHIRKYGVTGGIFFFDFSSYFANIMHDILIEEVKKKIMNDAVMKEYITFTCAFGDVGLGLGSQISQISALFYPNKIDHWIKDGLGISGYGRHMDDGYIICDDIEVLKEVANKFKAKCAAYGIVMNKKKCHIIRLSRQFVFLKTRFFVTKSGKIVKRISRDTVRKERHRLHKFHTFYECGYMSFRDVYLNFHAWVMAQTRGFSFNALLNMIRFFNGLFECESPYHPTKLNTRKYRVINYIARIA